MASLSEDELLNAAESEVIDLKPDSPVAKTQAIFGKSIANMGLRGVSMAARFLFIVGIAHYLSPDDVGVFVLMYASTTLSILLLGARFDVYSTRALCAGERSSPAVLIRDQIVFHLIVYAIVLPLMVIVFIARILPWEIAGWFYVLTVLEHASQECNRLFVALGQPLRATFVFFLKSSAWSIVLLPLMVVSPSFRTLGWVWIAWTGGGVVSLVFSAFWMRSLGWRNAMKERIDWNWIKRGLRPSLTYTFAIGAVQLISTLDRYFLKASWSDAHVGVYGFYANLTSFISTFAETGTAAILLPTLIASAGSQDWGTYRMAMRKLSKGVWIIALVASVFAIALAPLILTFVKKAPIYAQYLPAFGILVISAAITTLAVIPHNALYTNHKDKEIARWSIVSFATALVGYVLLTPRFGIYGVSYASLVSSVVFLFGKWWSARKMSLPAVAR